MSDDYPGGWFGESWGAPVCDPAGHKPTPVGEPCLDCGREVVEGDRGMLLPHVYGESGEWRLVAYHLERFWRELGIAGSTGR